MDRVSLNGKSQTKFCWSLIKPFPLWLLASFCVPPSPFVELLEHDDVLILASAPFSLGQPLPSPVAVYSFLAYFHSWDHVLLINSGVWPSFPGFVFRRRLSISKFPAGLLPVWSFRLVILGSSDLSDQQHSGHVNIVSWAELTGFIRECPRYQPTPQISGTHKLHTYILRVIQFVQPLDIVSMFSGHPFKAFPLSQFSFVPFS